jgi:polyisoprenoid-binding protein YceI
MSKTQTTPSITPALSGTYQIDPIHSRFGFVARHAMVTKVRGSFNEFDGTIVVDAENPSRSTGEVTIQVASVDTRQSDRDAHLRTADFFDADNHATITYVSSHVAQTDPEHFEVVGHLTIRGVTKSVTLDVTFTGSVKDPYGHERIGFEATMVSRTRRGGLLRSL